MEKMAFKLIALWVLSLLPRRLSRKFLLAVQNRNNALNPARFQAATDFFEFIATQTNKEEGYSCLELGAGKDAVGSIICAHILAAKSVISVDVDPQLDSQQFKAAEKKFLNTFGKDRDSKANIIHYLAPFDLRTDWPEENDTNLVFSLNTLEHIPEAQLLQIIDNCYRRLPRGGYFVHFIDYSDHFSNISSAISEYNFYRFGPMIWNLFNPSLHFQNRLRHSDCITYMKNAGFTLVAEKKLKPQDAEAQLRRVPISQFFDSYTPDDLLTSAAMVIFRKDA